MTDKTCEHSNKLKIWNCGCCEPELLKDIGTSIQVTIPCYMCHGSGLVNVQACYACNGKKTDQDTFAPNYWCPDCGAIQDSHAGNDGTWLHVGDKL